AETAGRAEAAGIAMAGGPAELAGWADAVVTIVTSSDDVRAVMAGADGVLAGAPPGLLVVDMSTIAPAASREVAAACAARGIDFLDAPVSGGSFGAEAGTLTIMVGGEAAVLERARPLLAAMGDPERIFHAGPAGAGEVVKLANNLLVGAISAATLEALVLGVRAGVPLEVLVAVISVSSGSSIQLTGQLARRALVGEFAPGFMTGLLEKDLRLALDLAGEVGQEAPFAALAERLFAAAQAAGHGRQDYSALLLEMERAAGVTLRLPE
ncbi:MAG TPA: NAD(P)-dependent oxidoreductase, partial [Candidatus Dormibacteraeota bacterium]|nr:NAD(P)-dependent oxidoreductase [Candidatus Dormibacteraeota bacterium]